MGRALPFAFSRVLNNVPDPMAKLNVSLSWVFAKLKTLLRKTDPRSSEATWRGIGYLLGGWHAATPRNTDLSPAQSVALRFPERADGPVTMSAVRDTVPSAMNSNGNMVLGDPQLLLLNPDPMVPRPSEAPQPLAATAAPEAAPPLPGMPSPRPAPAAARRTSQAVPPAVGAISRSRKSGSSGA